LNDGWKSLVLGALRNEQEPRDNDNQQNRLRGALENLRKQHLWGDISDDGYRQERTSLERQLKSVSYACIPPELPNLERAAQLLNDLPALWSHPGVMDEQREALVQEIFSEITVDGKALVAIKPKEAYAPLFASMLLESPVGYCDLDSPPSPPETHTSLRGDL
jgi:hypothetical protein